MADLTKVQVRTLVNETDIGKVRPGLSASVRVDAYPDRPFVGVVEKIEPKATVQQSVTMFPVLVSIDNQQRLLMPGMNGEVSIEVERRENVLAIPNDAVRNQNEVVSVATLLGLDPDSVRAQIRNASGGGRPDGGTQATNASFGDGNQGGSQTASRGSAASADGDGQQGGGGEARCLMSPISSVRP